MKLLLSTTLTLLFLFAFVSCKKDDNIEPEDGTNDTNHTSALKENSGWSTYAYSEDAFLGPGTFSHITTIPSSFLIHLGTVEQNKPSFFSSWRFNSQNWFPQPYQAQMLYENNGKMLAIEMPFAMGTDQDLGKEGRLSSGKPHNIESKLNVNYTYINNFFFHEGNVYAWSDAWRKVFNYWRNSYSVKSIVNSSGTRYGWFSEAHKSTFPSSVDFTGNPLYTNVVFADVGKVDLMGSEPTLKVMTVGKFHDSKADGSVTWRACLIEKNWNTLTDSADHVYPLPFNQTVHNENIQTQTFCNNGKILSTIQIHTTRELFLAFGDKSSGMKYIGNYTDARVIDVIESKSYFFCIYTDDAGNYNGLKVNRSGNVEQFTDIPFGTYSHYKGDLIVGESINNSVTISKITSSGTQIMGSENITKNSSGITFASDGDHLYAAIENCVSPVFSGGAGQFCGYEIIKFN